MKCNYCEWLCDLSQGAGICGRYHLKGGQVAEVEPFGWIQLNPYTIESMPFYHVAPNSLVLQTGSVSCTAGCDYCINAGLAITGDKSRALEHHSPEQLLSRAQQAGISGVVFALNEVSVFLPSALAVAEVFHRAGMLVGCLTNGFQTEESAMLLAKNMDFISVSLKSCSDKFYQQHLRLSSVQPVLRNIRCFAAHTHLEIVTPLVREILGDDIMNIRDFLADVDPEIIWHLFRLMPTHERQDEPELDHDQLLRIYEQARVRLPFTYLGNFAGSRYVDTYCPDCGQLLIKRLATGAWSTRTLQVRLQDDKCPHCGRVIPLVKK